MEKRSKMSAVRTDCSGRGAKRMGATVGGASGGIRFAGTAQGGMGLGSPQRCSNQSGQISCSGVIMEHETYSKLEIFGCRCDNGDLLRGRGVVHRLGSRGCERDAAY